MPRKKKYQTLPNLPDPNASMPADRMMYHRNKNVALAPNTAGNREAGNVGRALDPVGGDITRGVSGEVMRKGQPQRAAYSGDFRSKVGLGFGRAMDTIEGMDQQITGSKPLGSPTRPAPRAATNSPGGMPQRRPPPRGATLSDTMNGMAHTPGYEPFPARKKRR